MKNNRDRINTSAVVITILSVLLCLLSAITIRALINPRTLPDNYQITSGICIKTTHSYFGGVNLLTYKCEEVIDWEGYQMSALDQNCFPSQEKEWNIVDIEKCQNRSRNQKYKILDMYTAEKCSNITAKDQVVTISGNWFCARLDKLDHNSKSTFLSTSNDGMFSEYVP